MLDLTNVLRKPVYQGGGFRGDAAMALDPMSGVGCGFAIKTADWLAEHTLAGIRGEADLQASLEQYAQFHGQQLMPTRHRYLR